MNDERQNLEGNFTLCVLSKWNMDCHTEDTKNKGPCKGVTRGYNGDLQPETLADRQLVKQAQPASSWNHVWD